MLAEHFFWRGLYFDDDRSHCIEWYREALAWNPAHSNAQTNLEKLEAEAKQEEDDDEGDNYEYDGYQEVNNYERDEDEDAYYEEGGW